MTKAEEILLEVENKHEHRMADHLYGHEKEMVLDAINTALNIPVVSNNEVAVCENCGYTSTPDMVKWHGDACKNMINKQTDC